MFKFKDAAKKIFGLAEQFQDEPELAKMLYEEAKRLENMKNTTKPKSFKKAV